MAFALRTAARNGAHQTKWPSTGLRKCVSSWSATADAAVPQCGRSTTTRTPTSTGDGCNQDEEFCRRGLAHPAIRDIIFELLDQKLLFRYHVSDHVAH